MFLSSKEVCRATSLKKTTLYKYVKQGHFPPGFRIGLGRVAWLRSEVEAWGHAVTNGLSFEERRAFVAELVENRRKEVK